MAMEAEPNGNSLSVAPGVGADSAEDLSDYTDADESMSAPTECLAEFLSAVMLKDYPMALKYCKLILQYEPFNITAKEFYPLIASKVNQMDKTDNNSTDSSSECDDNYNIPDMEPETEHHVDIHSDDNGGDSDTSECGSTSSKESGGPCESNSAASGGPESEGTTHSCSSLEDEEAELLIKSTQRCLDLGNGNHDGVTGFPPSTSSDSSPTEPLTQQAVAMLRARALSSGYRG